MGEWVSGVLVTDSVLCSPSVWGPNIAVGEKAIVNEVEIYQQCLWLPEPDTPVLAYNEICMDLCNRNVIDF